LQVGEDHIIYSGEVKALTDGIASWLTQYNMAQFQYDTSYFFHGTIDSLWVNANGDIVILDANGNQTIVVIDTNGGALFTDSNGDQWIVNANGTVTFVTGGFLLPLTNDTLTTQEMRILKSAMSQIRSELEGNTIANQEAAANGSKQQLENFIVAQQQNIPSATISHPDSSEVITVRYYEVASTQSDQGAALGSNFKTAQLNYYASRVLEIMSRNDCPDAELNFIGQYLTVNAIPFKNYVAQQLALGKTEVEIATVVNTNGIKSLVILLLKKQMSRN
jgi:hypothetical protein